MFTALFLMLYRVGHTLLGLPPRTNRSLQSHQNWKTNGTPFNNLAILPHYNLPNLALNGQYGVSGQVKGIWKWSHWISHAPRPCVRLISQAPDPWDRHHQHQVYIFRTKPNLPKLYLPKMPQLAILNTHVTPRGLIMVPMNFPQPKTWV